ncbi:MAG TPA: hypothetical protein VMT09_02460 [Steroidobacteraceae bacterium]|nr:hypothetical protein [Steroidobacteraceae bacterium]
MTRLRPTSALVAALTMLCFALAQAANAAVPVHVVKTDLRPLIRAASQSRVQFAVPVPHRASTSSDGKWSVSGDRATWTYAVRVPTAVSMSFHAVQVTLPESAALVVRGAKTVTSYRTRDVHRGEIWSRIYPGDALQITLTVAAAQRSKVALSIVSVQAGYRSLGPGVADHLYYRQLMAAQPLDNTACVTNYECQVTTANTPPAAATVALVVQNLYTCTGSLINDVPNDNTPYVLTARHCETGTLGGGDPGAASSVVVYWDATSACGATLGSIYDGNIATQTGAQTMVEQQDAWLIRLDASPVVSDAQFVGFDASGGAVQGGYSIHHARGYDKQFVEWYGQAYAAQISGVNGTNYVSDFLETVNQLGNTGEGGSGGALIDQHDHLVASLTGAPQGGTDATGFAACPVTPLTAPNGSNAVALFTSLAAIWNSTADATSTTGAATLKSVLDPANSGMLVVASQPALVIEFSGFYTDIFTVGTPEVIGWTAANATQCTASGGVAGDGWTGTLPASGTITVNESAAGTVTYTLTCTFPGGRTATASETFQWVLNPQVQFNTPFTVWTTRPAVLSWSSNVGPCSITGGGLSLSNLPVSGSTTTTQASAGDVTYTLSCGTTGNSESLGALVQYVAPSLTFGANGTDRLLGQTFYLLWQSYADSCAPSGGAPGDGWATTSFGKNGALAQFSPKVTTVGTYTYSLTCSSGPISLQQSTTVTFENNAPYASVSIDPSSVTYSDSPADYVTLTWNSNLSNCSLNTTPNIPEVNVSFLPFDSLPLPQGTLTLGPVQSGSYQLSMTCIPAALNPSVTSAPVTLTVLPPSPPTATISFNPASVVAGQNFTVSWSSTNASGCSQTGGVPGGQWGSPMAPPAGSVTETGAVGDFTFGLTCQSIDPSTAAAVTQANIDIVALTASLTSSATSVTTGNSFTLTWSSTGASACTASGGGANGSTWSGPLAPSGSTTQTASVAGSFTYTVECNSGPITTTPQQVTIQVSAASSGGGGGGGGGGHGGGGGLGLLELGSLAALAGLRRLPGRRLRQQERMARGG